MSSRIDILRSKAQDCEWTAQLTKDEDIGKLFLDIARQYRNLADQLERLSKLQYPVQIDGKE